MIIIEQYSTTWCGPCKILSPIVQEVVSEREDVQLIKFDADQEQERVKAENVRGVPTLIFKRDGEVLKRHTGAMSKKQLEDILDSLN